MTEASKKRPRVAIDGPAGAGKSTVARGLAERLGYVLVDTGAIYRTVALAARREGVSWDDSEGLGKLAERLVAEGAIKLERGMVMPPQTGDDRPTLISGSGVRVLLRGEDVSSAIRTPEISGGASRVSAVPAVRASLLDLQRQAGEQGGVVLEGRDIGTVVFPDAEVKFFLTATAEIRARRRFDEDIAKGTTISFEDTLADVIRRDRADSERAVAPLRKAEDAIEVDSTGKRVDQIIEEMARVVEDRAKRS
ncbi:MAG: (d)CMP kinase [Polyangiaceae bacterium]|nr:(d)CMP kinase [Polyangiaceae bacterium]NUQ78994.1 (d)CMP kinase [Polyangiaceae bacterium]